MLEHFNNPCRFSISPTATPAFAPKEKMSAVGIDIGNSKCTIAAVVKRNVEIILNDMSNRFTPTMVAFGSKRRTFGEAAKVQEITNLKNTIGSLKRILGLSYAQIMESEGRFLFNNSISEKDGQVYITVAYKGEQISFTPLQLMAALLTGIRETCEASFEAAEGTVKNCVITIPAYYSELQTRLMEQAATLAGLSPYKLQIEPSAVALEYGIYRNNELDEKEPRIVIFVDVGQSASTATVVSYLKGKLEIKGIAYDAHFGGRNIDLALFDSLVGEFNKRHGIDICSNPKAVSRLMAACERAKKILSANSVTNLNVESIMNDIDVSCNVTRENMESLCAAFFPKISQIINSALEMAGIAAEKVHFVELCGSSCRVPAIRDCIAGVFSGKQAQISATLNFEEAVARGATMQCAILSPSFRVREFAVKEVVQRPIFALYDASEEKPDDTGCVLFAVGSAFPALKEFTFKRNKEFSLSFGYADTKEILSSYKLPACRVENGKLKVRVRMNINGQVLVDSAQWIEEKIVLEEAAPSAAAGANSTSEETKAPVEKKVITTEDAPFSGGFVVPGLASPVQMATFAKLEDEIRKTAVLVRKTEEQKNAVENYIYDMRDKLEGQFLGFYKPEEREKIVSLLENTQNWLYEQGEDSTLEEYSKKYAALSALGDPIVKRHHAASILQEAVAQFEKTCSEYLQQAQSSTWTTEEQRNEVLGQIASRSKQVQDAFSKQREIKPWEKPVYIAADVHCERADLISTVGPMLVQKVVPPVEENSQKPASPAAAEDAAEQAENAVPEQQEPEVVKMQE